MKTSTFWVWLIGGVILGMSGGVDGAIIISDFQDGTTQGWRNGRPPASAVTPTHVDTGGPAGTGDGYLSVISNGGFGAFSKIAVFNLLAPWIGDFTSQGIEQIEMDLRNFGDTDLNIRVVLYGSGGGFVSSESVDLSAGSDWVHGSVSINPSNLIGAGASNAGPAGTDVAATLSNVTQVWLIHNPDAGFPPPVVVSDIGVDNIAAEVPEPGTAAVLIACVMATGLKQRGVGPKAA